MNPVLTILSSRRTGRRQGCLLRDGLLRHNASCGSMLQALWPLSELEWDLEANGESRTEFVDCAAATGCRGSRRLLLVIRLDRSCRG